MPHSPLKASCFFALVIATACGTSSTNAGADASSFAQAFCIDPTSLAQGTPALRLTPDAGAPVNRQHIKVGNCEAYLLSWLEPNATYSDELITNCATKSKGGPATSQGFSAECLLETSGTGGVDGTAITMNCVCCADGQCGRYCHPVSLGDSGGGVKCASYSYDFQTSAIQDPRTHPEACDCAGW